MNYKFLIPALIFVFACNNKPANINKDAVASVSSDVEYIHAAEKKLTDIIVTDIFTPPVASRVYVYPMIAAYEAGRFSKSGYNSLTSKMKGFDALPIPEKNKTYNFTIAAIKALCTTAKKVVFSTKVVDEFETKTLSELKAGLTDTIIYNNSIAFGESVANGIIKKLNTDYYKETRGMERFEVKDLVGRWTPTPPDYADGVEPNWAKMKTLVTDSAGQISAVKAAPYSEDINNPFWKEVLEVHRISKSLTDEQENTISFWDDNPFVSRHRGHLMFQDKKMTPGGHWMAICQLVLKENKSDFAESLQAYAVTSVALHEAFLSCWAEKYKSNRLRPETIISAKIEKQWHPFLITPPFPSYTSGHSTVSAAAAEVLTNLFGNNFAYTDTTEKEYGLPVRSFTSFRQAALEASMSRLYAGIHFRSDCENGNKQGIKVGELVIKKLR